MAVLDSPRCVRISPVAWFSCLLSGLTACPTRADDAEIAKVLKEKGVTVTEKKGAVIAVALSGKEKLTDEEFALIGRLPHLKSLGVGGGMTDSRLAQLTELAELESIGTNGAQITDDGLKPLAKLQNLRTLTLFHPGRSFSGAGLAHLPHLERLTVAGSFAFNDEGMAAVAKLTKLQEFRTWHAGVTLGGVKKLTALKNLKTLTLGQRLTYKAPACPADDTLAVLAELKSLEVLRLSEARLTYDALKQLTALAALKKLTLEGIDMPKADVERLMKDLPQAKVEWTEPNEGFKKRIQALHGSK